MNKLSTYLINGFLSAVIGAVIDIISSIMINAKAVTLYNLIESMCTGVFIGTISIFFILNVVLRLKEKPFWGFISNFTVVALLMSIGAAYDWMTSPKCTFFDWIIAFCISEVLSFMLTAMWYRQISLYKIQLEKKKSSLNN